MIALAEHQRLVFFGRGPPPNEKWGREPVAATGGTRQPPLVLGFMPDEDTAESAVQECIRMHASSTSLAEANLHDANMDMLGCLE